jgi:hypothetical protein
MAGVPAPHALFATYRGEDIVGDEQLVTHLEESG